MSFTLYDDDSRPSIDLPTQRQLNELHKRHGNVGFRQLESGEGWCVRIVMDSTDETLPLAAIGPSLHDAANRMLRIVMFMESKF